MAEELGFDVEEFMAMAPRQRAEICTLMAERVQGLAAACLPERQVQYLTIAKEWLWLAEDAIKRSRHLKAMR
jgi:hypothetical protein